MDHISSSPIESENSIRLQISELSARLSDQRSISPTIFEPQTNTKNAIKEALVPPVRAPEKKLTLFALRLAILEKTASGIGTLGFIWATVVLLGGFAITLEKTDFWFITVILLNEGTRIFSRSRELEWQHQATWSSITDVGINSFRAIKSSSNFLIKTVKKIGRPVGQSNRQQSRELLSNRQQGTRNNCVQENLPKRIWTSSDVPLLPYAKWVFISRNVSRILYWLQLASATACVVLSMIKLVHQNYGEVKKDESDKKNRKAALIIFYSLALAEALLFLLEKAYWEWKVSVKNILQQVNKECELGDDSGLISIKRFFYDAYSRCVNGSIFDGLKMDMVSFSIELLDSNSPDEQLIGARILQKFSTKPQFSKYTLQKIGINISAMERLIEMLNWKDAEEEEIRICAAEILSKLAGKQQNSLRIAGIPGAMESISSLLHTTRTHNRACDEISEKKVIFDKENYYSWAFNQLGLQILMKLAREHDNCGKIGNTRGLLPKIIDFIHADERLLTHSTETPSQIPTVKRSLQVLKMLASTSGSAGKQLRKDISEIVFTISYIRDILKYGEKQPELQILGIEILRSLAIDKDATEKIGGTGGVIRELFKIFFNGGIGEEWGHVRGSAGEAIAMLALRGKKSCERILKLKVNGDLIEGLRNPLLRVHAARVLRNLCAYSGDDCFEELKSLTAAGPTIVEAIMKKENKLQEVMIGAASCIFKFMTPEESKIMFRKAEITEFDLVHRLFLIVKKYQNPSTKLPSIRRYAIELAIWMMRYDKTNIQSFDHLGMEKELESVMETTSELESFNIFSGTVGLCRHSITMQSLVETAIKMMEEERNRRD